MPLPPGARVFVERSLGPIVAAQPVGSGGSAFRIEAEGGQRAYLKAHQSKGKHDRERRAYTRWAPRLSAKTPGLIAASDAPRALLLEALPGAPVRLHATEAPDLFAAAGRVLRSLHSLSDPSEDPMPIAEALVARVESWSARARAIAPRLAAHLEARIREAAPLTQGTLRVPCHRDFEPRNWLAVPTDAGLELGLFDFEHSRPDLWLADLTRLEAQVWPRAPHLEAAFWDGYGVRPDPDARAVLRALAELDAGVTYVWGVAHADDVFIARGLRALAQRGLAGC